MSKITATISFLVISVLLIALPTNGLVPFTRTLWDLDDPFGILEQTPLSVPKTIESPGLTLARADWKETQTARIINLDIPGMKKEDVKIEVEEGDKWHRSEGIMGKLWRQFRLPLNADLEMADEWPMKDNRRFLHAVYNVGNLDRTIKFYTECFGMKVQRKRDVPEEKYSNAFLGFGPEDSHFAVELTYNYGVDKYEIGTGFGHFAIATQDIYKMVEVIRAKGGTITREPGPVIGGSTVIAFVKDPDGYPFKLIQRGPTPEPFCQVMLRVGDLDRSIKFYEKALGMKVVKKVDRPEQKYTIAMLGYGPEEETTVLELTYNYGVTEYTKGNAYAQVAIGTDDVFKSAEVVDLVTQELGGKITQPPGPPPGLNTKIVGFLDPEGWKTVLVDNEDFLRELM